MLSGECVRRVKKRSVMALIPSGPLCCTVHCTAGWYAHASHGLHVPSSFARLLCMTLCGIVRADLGTPKP